MHYLVIAALALAASALTFFSGFGLGTLLLPAFAFFFTLEQAIALTAVVHFLNGLFKLALVRANVAPRIVLTFGIPAMLASIAGAWVLLKVSGIDPLLTYTAFGRLLEVTPIKLVVGTLLVAFALMEVVPRFRDLTFSERYMPLGGLLSGFFGGLAGMQGALRSAFLARADLSKEVFIATGVAAACLIDVSRLGVYATSIAREWRDLDTSLLAAAVLAAFAGAALGNRYLRRMTMTGIQRIVAAMLFAVGAAMIAGLL